MRDHGHKTVALSRVWSSSINAKSYQQKLTRSFGAACFFCFVVVVGMSAAYAQSDDFMNRLGRLENEMDTLNRAVYKGEKPPPSLYTGNAASGSEVRLQQLETQIRDLTGKIEQQSYDMQQLGSRLNEVEAAQRGTRVGKAPSAIDGNKALYNRQNNTALPAQGTDTGNIDYGYRPPETSQDPSLGMKTATPAPSNNAAGQYEQAFSYLKSGDYGAAEKGFDRFLKQYPDHALSANAIYWLGETHYVRNDYAKAAQVFAKAYQKYPGGPKGADNLLKLGMSLGGMGKTKDACVALGQLKTEYPKGPTPVLRRAQQESDKLNCR